MRSGGFGRFGYGKSNPAIRLSSPLSGLKINLANPHETPDVASCNRPRQTSRAVSFVQRHSAIVAIGLLGFAIGIVLLEFFQYVMLSRPG